MGTAVIEIVDDSHQLVESVTGFMEDRRARRPFWRSLRIARTCQPNLTKVVIMVQPIVAADFVCRIILPKQEWDPMFIRQLHYLLALNKYRHFGRAAESCHVSQPALSNGIRELERELGITVVKRDRSFRAMTPEGERVIIWARRTLESLEALRQEAELVRDVPSGHLSIGVVPTAIHAASILSAEYRQITSRITLDVRSLSTPEILHLLDDQELHLAMLYASSVSDEVYDLLPVFAERYVLLAAEQAVLPRELSWGEVADLPLCLLSRDMWNRQVLDGIFQSHDAAPNVVLETNALRVILAEVRSARSFSIIPLSALPAEGGAAGLIAHPITPDHVEDVCLVRLKRGAQTALTHAAWKIAGNLDFQDILDDPWTKQSDYFRNA